MARLTTFVHVTDVSEDGELRSGVFGPADDLPDWAVRAITNPKVWAEAPPESVPGPAATGGEGDLVEPPRAGKGSGLEAWRGYANKLGWFEDIPEDATRDDIVKAIDEYRDAHVEKKAGE